MTRNMRTMTKNLRGRRTTLTSGVYVIARLAEMKLKKMFVDGKPKQTKTSRSALQIKKQNLT